MSIGSTPAHGIVGCRRVRPRRSAAMDCLTSCTFAAIRRGGSWGSWTARSRSSPGRREGRVVRTPCRLAQDGADVIAIDICAQLPSVHYPMATPEDLEQTVAEVEALGRRIVARHVDVRDIDAMKSAYAEGVDALGPVRDRRGQRRDRRRRRRDSRGAVGDRPRRQPHRGVEHRPGRDPPDDQGRSGWVDRADQLHGRAHRRRSRFPRLHRLHRGEARRRRSHAFVGQLPARPTTSV